MLRRDFLISMLQDFFEKLSQRFSKGLAQKETLKELGTFYVEYFQKDARFFIETDPDGLIDFLDVSYQEDKACRTEMLAELLYRQARSEEDAEIKKDLYAKAFVFFLRSEESDKTYSFERVQKMEECRRGAYHCQISTTNGVDKTAKNDCKLF